MKPVRMLVLGLLSCGLLSAGLFSAGCASSLEGGEYQLEGEALLETAAERPDLRTEAMTLFVADDGTPTRVHDHRYDETFIITFSADESLSDDLCERAGCELRVERNSGCAVWTYEMFFRPAPGSDTGHAYTGVVRACPTGESS